MRDNSKSTLRRRVTRATTLAFLVLAALLASWCIKLHSGPHGRANFTGQDIVPRESRGAGARRLNEMPVPPQAVKVPAGNIPADKAPFDVGAAIEQVRSAFETTEQGFRGGRPEYGVRASGDGIALTARHWPQKRREGTEPQSDGDQRQSHHQPAPSTPEKPLESPELVLRTTHVGRGAGQTDGALGDDEMPMLQDDARLVAWERENHTEHLRQTPQGVEQSWAFPTKPEGNDALVVRVEVSGLTYVSETVEGLHFADARGLGFRYGHGTWVDATGLKTAVNAHYRNGTIELTVPHDVVEHSAYPAVLDPVVGPEFGLQGVMAARGTQHTPTIASNGTDYLVAWREERSLGGLTDIYAARVSAAGVVLDDRGLALSVDQPGESNPCVASDGSDYLVVWQETRPGSDPESDSESDSDIRANRVTAAGDVLDGSGFPVATGTSEQSHPGVASNGSGYLVTWMDSRSGSSDVYASRVNAAGTVLDGDGFGVSTGVTEEGAPSVASNGVDYLVAWTDSRSGTSTDIYFSRVSSAGQVLDPTGLLLSAEESNENSPSVASNGTTYLIAWNDMVGEGAVLEAGGERGTHANRVSSEGLVLDGGVLVVSNPYSPMGTTHVASNGTDFLVLGRVGGSLYGRRVSGSGSVLDASDFKVAPSSDSGSSMVASNGSGYLVAHVSRETAGSMVFRGAATRVSEAGIVGKRFAVVPQETNAQMEPAVASNGTDFLVTWKDYRNDRFGIYASRVSAEGEALDAPGLFIDGGHPEELQVASNGSGYLVLWRFYRVVDEFWGVCSVHVRAVGASGQLEEAQSLGAGEDHHDPSLASNGSDYLVVWREYLKDDLYGVRVSDTGEFKGAALEFAHSPYGWSRAASNRKDYLVVWLNESGVYARRLTAKGKLEGAPAFAVSTAGGNQWNPVVASNGGDYLVAWTDERSGIDSDIYANRVTSTGVQDTSGFPISTAPGDQYGLDIASSGQDYLVSWADHRAGSQQTYGAKVKSEPLMVSEFLVGDGGSVKAAGRDDRYLIVSDGQESGISKIALRFIITDECPNDPNKDTDFDLDVDGTLNCNDGCPTNPKKTSPGVCGCNAFDVDTDGDGTADCVDPCPDDEQDACVEPPDEGEAEAEGGAGAGGMGGDVSHATDDNGDEESGCGCRTAGRAASPSGSAFLFLAGVVLALSRRRSARLAA